MLDKENRSELEGGTDRHSPTLHDASRNLVPTRLSGITESLEQGLDTGEEREVGRSPGCCRCVHDVGSGVSFDLTSLRSINVGVSSVDRPAMASYRKRRILSATSCIVFTRIHRPFYTRSRPSV